VLISFVHFGQEAKVLDKACQGEIERFASVHLGKVENSAPVADCLVDDPFLKFRKVLSAG
jgi:hypothetical protein